MNSKSGFLVFILSWLPGLSHYYLGMKKRAALFFAAFAGAGAIAFMMCMVLNDGSPLGVFMMFACFEWFFALVDAMICKNRPDLWSSEVITPQEKRTALAVVFSFVPGAGHMYLGYMKQGVQLMAIFFFTGIASAYLEVSLLFAVVPVIWFYALFDALQKSSLVPVKADAGGEVSLMVFIREHAVICGWALILMAGFAVLNIADIFMPYLNFDHFDLIRRSIQTGVITVLLFVGGVMLIRSSHRKTMDIPDDDEMDAILALTAQDAADHENTNN